MELIVDKPFYRDIKRIKNIEIQDNIKQIFANIENAKTFKEIKNCRKLENYKSKKLYRIEAGFDYRLILSYEEGAVVVVALTFLPRREVYEKKHKKRLDKHK